MAIRNLNYQLTVIKNNPKLAGRFEQLNAYEQQVKNQKTREIEQQKRNAILMQQQYDQELAAYNQKLAKQKEEEYYLRKRQKRSNTYYNNLNNQYTTQTIDVINAPPGYQGITTREGVTLQNIKTGEIIQKYKITPQEEAKRELLMDANFIKPTESKPTEFLMLRSNEKPKELKEVFGYPYLINNQERAIIEQQKQQKARENYFVNNLSTPFSFKQAYRERFQNPASKNWRFPNPVVDAPFFVEAGVKSTLGNYLKKTGVTKNKSYVAGEKYFEFNKTGKVIKNVISESHKDLYLFGFFSPYMKTDAQILKEYYDNGNLVRVDKNGNPQVKRVKVEINPVTDKRANVKGQVTTYEGKKVKEVSITDQRVQEITNKLNEGYGRNTVFTKETEALKQAQSFNVYSQGELINNPTRKGFKTVLVTDYQIPKKLFNQYRTIAGYKYTSEQLKGAEQLGKSIFFIKEVGKRSGNYMVYDIIGSSQAEPISVTAIGYQEGGASFAVNARSVKYDFLDLKGKVKVNLNPSFDVYEFGKTSSILNKRAQTSLINSIGSGASRMNVYPSSNEQVTVNVANSLSTFGATSLNIPARTSSLGYSASNVGAFLNFNVKPNIDTSVKIKSDQLTKLDIGQSTSQLLKISQINKNDEANRSRNRSTQSQLTRVRLDEVFKRVDLVKPNIKTKVSLIPGTPKSIVFGAAGFGLAARQGKRRIARKTRVGSYIKTRYNISLTTGVFGFKSNRKQPKGFYGIRPFIKS